MLRLVGICSLSDVLFDFDIWSIYLSAYLLLKVQIISKTAFKCEPSSTTYDIMFHIHADSTRKERNMELKHIRAIIGLGNPTSAEVHHYDDRYKDTRHNVGYDTINKILAQHNEQLTEHQITIDTPNGLKSIKWHTINDMIVMKAACHGLNLNQSGIIVEALAKHYELQANEILIIMDDLDMSAGAVKWKTNGGAGGHNGIKSIINHLNSQDFMRLKIGIGRPPLDVNNQPSIPILDYVLTPLSKDHPDYPLLQQGIQTAYERIKPLLDKP